MGLADSGRRGQQVADAAIFERFRLVLSSETVLVCFSTVLKQFCSTFLIQNYKKPGPVKLTALGDRIVRRVIVRVLQNKNILRVTIFVICIQKCVIWMKQFWTVLEQF